MKIHNNISIESYQNIFAILGIILMFFFTIKEGVASYGIREIFAILLPMGVSNLVWNKKRYKNITSDKSNTFSTLKITYKQFIIFSLVLSINLDIAILYRLIFP